MARTSARRRRDCVVQAAGCVAGSSEASLESAGGPRPLVTAGGGRSRVPVLESRRAGSAGRARSGERQGNLAPIVRRAVRHEPCRNLARQGAEVDARARQRTAVHVRHRRRAVRVAGTRRKRDLAKGLQEGLQVDRPRLRRRDVAGRGRRSGDRSRGRTGRRTPGARRGHRHGQVVVEGRWSRVRVPRRRRYFRHAAGDHAVTPRDRRRRARGREASLADTVHDELRPEQHHADRREGPVDLRRHRETDDGAFACRRRAANGARPRRGRTPACHST